MKLILGTVLLAIYLDTKQVYFCLSCSVEHRTVLKAAGFLTLWTEDMLGEEVGIALSHSLQLMVVVRQ